MVDAHKAAAAGVFYPADGEALSRTVRSLLDAAPVSRTSPRIVRPRGIVVPHGVFGAAGSVAAAGWGPRLDAGARHTSRSLARSSAPRSLYRHCGALRGGVRNDPARRRSGSITALPSRMTRQFPQLLS